LPTDHSASCRLRHDVLICDSTVAAETHARQRISLGWPDDPHNRIWPRSSSEIDAACVNGRRETQDVVDDALASQSTRSKVLRRKKAAPADFIGRNAPGQNRELEALGVSCAFDDGLADVEPNVCPEALRSANPRRRQSLREAGARESGHHLGSADERSVSKTAAMSPTRICNPMCVVSAGFPQSLRSWNIRGGDTKIRCEGRIRNHRSPVRLLHIVGAPPALTLRGRLTTYASATQIAHQSASRGHSRIMGFS
jgi:hypothetical protein